MNDRKIIGCRKNILSIFVALLTFYKFIIKKKKKKISHFKMPTLNSDVTVNSYNDFYLFSMKYLYRNDSIWKFVTMFCHTRGRDSIMVSRHDQTFVKLN